MEALVARVALEPVFQGVKKPLGFASEGLFVLSYFSKY
jgi:hypothetical protein